MRTFLLSSGGFSGELFWWIIWHVSNKGGDYVKVRIFFRVIPLRDVTLCHDDHNQEDYWL